jgi:DNA-binding response OmpR family regulator
MSTATTFETIPLTEIVRKGLVADTNPHCPVVLIVDDDEIIADTRAAIFRSWGYMAMVAYNAESALTLARLSPPELLVSDTILIGTNGVDLAIQVKQAVPGCKVLLLSGLPLGAELLAEAQAAGPDFTALTKPLHPSQLLAHITKLNIQIQTSSDSRQIHNSPNIN